MKLVRWNLKKLKSKEIELVRLFWVHQYAHKRFLTKQKSIKRKNEILSGKYYNFADIKKKLVNRVKKLNV